MIVHIWRPIYMVKIRPRIYPCLHETFWFSQYLSLIFHLRWSKTHFSLSFKSRKIVFYYVFTKVAGFFFEAQDNSMFFQDAENFLHVFTRCREVFVKFSMQDLRIFYNLSKWSMHACACEIFSAFLTRALQRFNLKLIQRRLKISKNGASVSCFELSGLLVSRPGQGWTIPGQG